MATSVSQHWTVEQVIKTYPQTIRVFLGLRTDCVGCYLDRFCRLEDVAAFYNLPLEQMMQTLQDGINHGEAAQPIK